MKENPCWHCEVFQPFLICCSALMWSARFRRRAGRCNELGQIHFLLAQRDINVEDPDVEDLYVIGTICFIKQILRMPGGGIRVMVEGKYRARLVRIFSKFPYFDVEIAKIIEIENTRFSDHAEALIRQTHALLERYAELAPSVSPELLSNVIDLDNVGYIADYIAQNIYIKHSKKQEILDEPRPLKRIEKLNSILLSEIEVLEIELQLRKKTSDRMMKNQREHILREQLKTIQHELGLTGDDGYGEIDEYRRKY